MGLPKVPTAYGYNWKLEVIDWFILLSPAAKRLFYFNPATFLMLVTEANAP
jgi:hypothetical protein